MVTVSCRREDHGPLQAFLQGSTDHPVIQSPSLVLIARIGPVSPPGILVGLLVKIPETINKTAVDKVAYPFPLHGQKARDILVPDRVVYVDGPMADVVIPQDHQVGILLLEIIHIILEIGHVLQFVIQPFNVRPGRDIEAHHGNPVKISSQIPAFPVHVLDPCAELHVVRFLFGKDGHSAIPFLLRAKPVVVGITRLFKKAHIQLFFHRLDLLQADHIGVYPLKPIQESFVDGGTDPIHIVGNNLHPSNLGPKIGNPGHLRKPRFEINAGMLSPKLVKKRSWIFLISTYLSKKNLRMKYFWMAVLLFITATNLTSAQDAFPVEDLNSGIPQNELKLNVFNLIAFKFADLTYERLINEETSFGFGLLVRIGEYDEDIGYDRSFSFTPFYRKYFSRSYASGFFVEGFAMLNSGNEDVYAEFDEQTGNLIRSYEKYTDFALGVSIGGKFISKRGFLAEVYGGIGRNFLDSDFAPEVVPRGGISLGFRF